MVHTLTDNENDRNFSKNLYGHYSHLFESGIKICKNYTKSTLFIIRPIPGAQLQWFTSSPDRSVQDIFSLNCGH